MRLFRSRKHLLVGALLLVGVAAAVWLAVWLRRGHPVARFGPEDQNVKAGQVKTWSFDADQAGALPQGVEVFEGEWAIRAEGDAPTPPNVLCQTATAPFPALALDDKVYTDLDVSVRFKPVSGRTDQAAGALFRVQDRDNYYILRANALEDNVNFYIYASGRRSSLAGRSVKVRSGQWQELRVEIRGNHFRGFLNGELVVEATDDSYRAGRVGLWTKADSVTCFDDVQVTAR
jgi:hypothetical protein